MKNQSKSNTAVIIILVILGVIAVFTIGIVLGNVLPKSEANPPAVSPPTPAPEAPYVVAKD